jgi:SAM-dependent methyltransferase
MQIESWVPLFRCPFERAELQHEPSTGEESLLRCASCHRTFPIIDGIVRFLSQDDPHLSPEQRRESKARDRYATAYAHQFSWIRSTLESGPALRAMRPRSTDLVAELGCGTGRLTRLYAARVNRTVAIDFSLDSLLSFRRSIPSEMRDRVLLVYADISAVPLADHAFDKVVSFQVLEHLPTPEMRAKAARGAARILKRGGTLTLTVYNWSLSKQRLALRGIGDNTRKEGFHGGEIYYFNFEPGDVTSMLKEAGFELDRLRGLQMQVRGMDLVGPIAVPIDALISATPWGLRLGHLLLAHAHTAMAPARTSARSNNAQD